MSEPRLSVIVVAWNVRDMTLQCIRAVRERSAGISTEILLVDNASADGTVEAVRAADPAVRIVANRENAGFPRANNQALALARGEYVLFLNPDTEVGEGTVAACIAALDADPAVGMAGCRLLYADGSVQLECARRPYQLRHLLSELFYLHMLFPRSRIFAHHVMGNWGHRGTRDVEAICGAFMMARREMAQALGGLPEDLFMYHEDLSFCLRVRRAGWRIRYLGEHVTTHYWRQSSGRSSAALVLLEGEHKIRLIREAQGPSVAVAARAVFALRSLIRLAIAGAGMMLPRDSAARRHYPRVFDARRHALHLVWSVAPWLVRDRIPRAPARPALETAA